MTNPITPTIGRIVWYVHPVHRMKCPARISCVHSDTAVSLHVDVPVHENPVEYIESANYREPNDTTFGILGTWCWMPYQRGQAVKADELEKKFMGIDMAKGPDRSVETLVPVGCVAVTIGRVGYEAYAGHTGWKSLVSGAALPLWENLSEPIRTAWETAAAAIVRHKA